MLNRSVRLALLLFASLLLFACAGEKLELEVKAAMDGQPAADVKVTVDGKDEGATDAKGHFSKIIRKKPGADVEVVASKEQAGYRI